MDASRFATDATGAPSGAAVLAQRVGQIPKELQPRLRPVLRSAAEDFKARAAAEASWSTRIPRSLSIRVAFAGRKPGVFVVARSSIAPHARAYEGITQRGDEFRHPLFGDREVWVSQGVRPFFQPAAESVGPQLVDDLLKAMDDAAEAGGFK